MLMNWLGIYSYRLTERTVEFFKFFISYFIVVHIAAACISSAVFVLRETSQFNFKLEACIIVIGSTQCGGAYINIGMKMRMVKVLHLKLQQIVDKGRYQMNFAFFA